MELGYGCFVVFFALGALVGWIWRRVEKVAYWGCVYFFSVVYLLHWLHRGIPKLTYLIIPAMFLVFVKAGEVISSKTRSAALLPASQSRDP